MALTKEDIAGVLPFLDTLALQITRNTTEAKDLRQDTLVGLWQASERFNPTYGRDPQDALRKWSAIIMRRKHIDKLRRKKATPCDPNDFDTLQVSKNPLPDQQYSLVQTFTQIVRLATGEEDSFNPNHQETLKSYLEHGDTPSKEIAEATGVPPATFKQRTRRMRAALHQALATH